MAAPRVFISSTYYDLRHVREDIGNFIKSMGYEPVMHDRGGVTYAQSETLETSCYNELQNCDIVVCIIGNKYGTQSQDSNLSITMTELTSAIKARKKIYIYILKEVYYENRTYLLNKDNGFNPASVDNIKIHEFIAEIKGNVKNHPIEPFENISDITDNLRKQFAGLFQRLLAQEAAMTETKTAYDLQSSADKIKNTIDQFDENVQDFFKRFDGTIFKTNFAVRYLQNVLGHTKYQLFISNKDELFDFILSMGFYKLDFFVQENPNGIVFTKYTPEKIHKLTIMDKLFEQNGDIVKDADTEALNELISFTEEDYPPIVSKDKYPF